MFLPFSKPKNIEDVIKLIVKVLLVAVLFTPLVYDFSFYFPYIVVKNLIFRALIELAFFAYLFLIIRNRDYWPRFNKGLPIFVLFIFTLFISSLMGNGFTFSFWSNFERMDGLINWLHILVYMFTLIGVLRSKEEWRSFFNLFLIASWLVAFYAFVQFFEARSSLDIGFVKSGSINDRIHSTFGNAAYLGSYMLIATMLAFNSLIYRLQKGWEWFNLNFWLIVWYVLSIIVFVTSISLSETRGSMVGLMAFSFLMAVFYLWFNRGYKNKLYYAILSLLIVGALFVGLIFQQKESSWVQDSRILTRLSLISISHGTSQTRLMTWEKSLEGFKEKPIIGWGEENFKYVFDKYFPIKIYRNQASEVWFDRPHNILIQHLIHGGIVGLSLYLGIFFYLIFILFRNYQKHQHWYSRKKHWFFNFFWISFLLAFLIHDLFIFDNLNVNVILYLVLAYLFTVGIKIKKPSSKVLKFGTQKDYIFLVVILLICINVFVFVVYKPWKSNKMLIEALNQSYQAQNIEEANEAVDIWTEAGELTDLGDKERAEIATKMLNGFSANRKLSTEDKQRVLINFANIVQADLLKVTEKYPDDIRLKMFLVQFYGMIQDGDNAVLTLEEVKKIAPQRPESYINLSGQYLRDGNIDKALSNIEYYVSILPKENNNTYVYWNAFQANLYANKINKANEYLGLIKEANQNLYSYDFKDSEINILRQLVETSEANENFEVASMMKEYLP